MDAAGLALVMRAQDGVVSRRQVLESGFDDGYIERMLRRREWARVYRGVYVDHTGQLTWRQRAWAAVLFHWPAVLSHESAVTGGATVTAVIHIAIEHPRRPATLLPGVEVHRLRHLDQRAMWNLGPPRMRVEEAVLDMCAAVEKEVEVLATVTDACQGRLTTVERLRSALASRERVRHGRWLRLVLADVALGAMSVLEHPYLTRVERAHGLPSGRRQSRASGGDGSVYRDVEYEDYRLIIELDGRLWHQSFDRRNRDLERDLDAAVDGNRSLRVGWSQSVDAPCRTAEKVARILQQRGWTGVPRHCGSGCLLALDEAVVVGTAPRARCRQPYPEAADHATHPGGR